MRRALAPVVLALAASAVIGRGPADAQTALRPRLRPQPPPEAISPPTAIAPQSFPAGPPPRLALPDRSDRGPTCRAQCAKARASCESVAETCAPEWSTCLQRCAGSQESP